MKYQRKKCKSCILFQQNYPWKRHEEFASTAYEIYNGETYRLYTDNQNLKFVGYMMTAYQRIDTSYSLSATSCNIGYGSKSSFQHDCHFEMSLSMFHSFKVGIAALSSENYFYEL